MTAWPMGQNEGFGCCGSFQKQAGAFFPLSPKKRGKAVRISRPWSMKDRGQMNVCAGRDPGANGQEARFRGARGGRPPSLFGGVPLWLAMATSRAARAVFSGRRQRRVSGRGAVGFAPRPTILRRVRGVRARIGWVSLTSRGFSAPRAADPHPKGGARGGAAKPGGVVTTDAKDARRYRPGPRVSSGRGRKAARGSPPARRPLTQVQWPVGIPVV